MTSENDSQVAAAQQVPGAPRVALRETMRAQCGVAPLLERHLVRLASGGCGEGVLARVRAEVRLALEGLAAEGYARVGVTVTPDGEVSVGVTFDESSLAVPGGPRLVAVPVTELPTLPRGAAKPAVRRYWDKAHRAARMAGGDQAAIVAPNGTLVDGSTATIWLVVDGALVTAPAPPAIAGVARAAVFDLSAGMGLIARERVVWASELETADEVFLSNAVGWLVPVRGRAGEVFERVVREWERTIGRPATGQ